MISANKDKIYNFLEYLYKFYNNKEYIYSDPIRFPHEIKGDTEFIAFTAASFAYGNMKAIQGFLYKYFENAGSSIESLKTEVNDILYYRFQTKEDVAAYSKLMKKVYDQYGSIYNLFKAADAVSVENIDKGIILLRSYLDEITQGLNFLLPVPGKSASKRLYMFLRWMVRKDDVDFGFWNEFNKKSLYMPSDTHILRLACNLDIIDKNEKGRKAVIKVTDFFRDLNPEDPAKYDFSLTRLGIVNSCQYLETDICEKCFHKKVLPFPLTFFEKEINLVLIKRRLIMALEFNENNFKEEVLNSDKPVLVDFWAAWCGPCKLLGPTIDELHKELDGKVKVGKVNVDENQNLAAQFGVMSIPTVIIMKGGKIVEQFIGMQPKGVYVDALNKHM